MEAAAVLDPEKFRARFYQRGDIGTGVTVSLTSWLVFRSLGDAGVFTSLHHIVRVKTIRIPEGGMLGCGTAQNNVRSRNCSQAFLAVQGLQSGQQRISSEEFLALTRCSPRTD